MATTSKKFFRTESHRGTKLKSKEVYRQALNLGWFKKWLKFSKRPPQAFFRHENHIFGHIFGTESHRATEVSGIYS
jgi:hypothetical protein